MTMIPESDMPETVDIRIDEDLCAASALCQRVAPTLFSMPDDADTALALQSSVSDPRLIALAEEAAEGCPTMAIILGRRHS
jgi:ferredoxin